jgi:hypothetical protein
LNDYGSTWVYREIATHARVAREGSDGSAESTGFGTAELGKSAVGRLESGSYAKAIEEAAARPVRELVAKSSVSGWKQVRTAITATGVFLLRNGYGLLFEDWEAYNWPIEL